MNRYQGMAAPGAFPAVWCESCLTVMATWVEKEPEDNPLGFLPPRIRSEEVKFHIPSKDTTM